MYCSFVSSVSFVKEARVFSTLASLSSSPLYDDPSLLEEPEGRTCSYSAEDINFQEGSTYILSCV